MIDDRNRCSHLDDGARHALHELLGFLARFLFHQGRDAGESVAFLSRDHPQQGVVAEVGPLGHPARDATTGGGGAPDPSAFPSLGILVSSSGGTGFTIDTSGTQPLIRRKKVVLKNDYIHNVVDIYHI